MNSPALWLLYHTALSLCSCTWASLCLQTLNSSKSSAWQMLSGTRQVQPRSLELQELEEPQQEAAWAASSSCRAQVPAEDAPKPPWISTPPLESWFQLPSYRCTLITERKAPSIWHITLERRACNSGCPSASPSHHQCPGDRGPREPALSTLKISSFRSCFFFFFSPFFSMSNQCCIIRDSHSPVFEWCFHSVCALWKDTEIYWSSPRKCIHQRNCFTPSCLSSLPVRYLSISYFKGELCDVN